MRQLHIIQLSMKRIYNNPRAYLFGFLFLQSIRWLMAVPLLTFLFYQMLKAAGLSSITNANIGYLLTQPIALLFVTLLLFLLTFFIFFEFGYYFLLAHYDRIGQSVRTRHVVYTLWKKIPYFFSMHALVFTFYFLILLPVASLGLSSTWTEQLHIPRFITDELMNTTSGKMIFFTFLTVILLGNVRFIFSVYYFVTEPTETILGALRKSWHATKGKVVRIVTTLFSLLVTVSGVTILFIGLLLLPIYVLEKGLAMPLPLLAAFTLAFIQGVLFIIGALVQPLLTEAVTVMEREEGAKPDRVIFQKRKWVRHPSFVIIGSIVGLCIMTWIHYNTLTATVYQPITKIVAHRGYAAAALENTIPSLEKAAEAGADYVEMDIQQTKDGQFVVYHDETLRRLGNLEQSIGESTYDELVGLPLSNGRFKATLPSFTSYIERAKQLDIPLLVEVKTYGHESEELAAQLLHLLDQYDVLGTYIVQSLNHELLRELERLDGRIQTSDIYALNIGGVPKTPAPYVSIEDFSIRPSFMKALSEKEKQLFVWTVNDRKTMEDYMTLGIYGLITNYVSEAVALRDSYDEEITLFERLRYMIRKTTEANGILWPFT